MGEPAYNLSKLTVKEEGQMTASSPGHFARGIESCCGEGTGQSTGPVPAGSVYDIGEVWDKKETGLSTGSVFEPIAREIDSDNGKEPGQPTGSVPESSVYDTRRGYAEKDTGLSTGSVSSTFTRRPATNIFPEFLDPERAEIIKGLELSDTTVNSSTWAC